MSAHSRDWFERLPVGTQEACYELLYTLSGHSAPASERMIALEHENNTLRSQFASVHDERYTEIIRLLSNAKSRGDLGEAHVSSMLSRAYPRASIEDVSETRGDGDIRLVIDEETAVLLEIKNYSDATLRSNCKREIEAFHNVLRDTDDSRVVAGVFVSFRSEAFTHGRGHLSFDIVNDQVPCVIAACVNQTPSRLTEAIDLALSISELVRGYREAMGSGCKCLSLQQEQAKRLLDSQHFIKRLQKSIKDLQSQVRDEERRLSSMMTTGT